MGYDVCAKLIVGVGLTKKTIKTQITLYNERDGKPYQATEERTVYRINNSDLFLDPEVAEIEGEEICSGEEYKGLEIFSDWNDDPLFWGECMYTAKSGHTNSNEIVKIPAVCLVKDSIAEKLKESIGYEGEVGVFLYLKESC